MQRNTFKPTNTDTQANQVIVSPLTKCRKHTLSHSVFKDLISRPFLHAISWSLRKQSKNRWLERKEGILVQIHSHRGASEMLWLYYAGDCS